MVPGTSTPPKKRKVEYAKLHNTEMQMLPDLERPHCILRRGFAAATVSDGPDGEERPEFLFVRGILKRDSGVSRSKLGGRPDDQSGVCSQRPCHHTMGTLLYVRTMAVVGRGP